MQVKGWQLLALKLFQDRFTQLEVDVSRLAHRDPNGYVHHPKAKLLKSVFVAITDDVPTDPENPKFRQGTTLGGDYKHWRRVKRGLPQRYRLFFRFMKTNFSIVYAWLNDESTLRKKGSKTDVYTVFKKMLKNKEIPDSYDQLVKKAEKLEMGSESPG